MKTIPLFEKELPETPIVQLSDTYSDNEIYMKRDDLLPFSFGGNKVRKAAEFYKEIKAAGADVVMTYGSNSSNHCRIIANMTYAMGLKCHVISPEENREVLYNTALVQDFGATIETCPVTKVAETIDRRMEAFYQEGHTPYFIVGGGHGNPGTEGYVKCYQEILRQQVRENLQFDYIFHASGTGATQAGLVCGQLLAKDNQTMVSGQSHPQIVGISIAREEGRGRDVVRESIQEYLGDAFGRLYHEEDLVFTDAYRQGGYGQYGPEEAALIDQVMRQEGIPMDTTYVGKAFYGMTQYLAAHGIHEKRVLFIHTGGTPLYFDHLDAAGVKERS